MGKLIELLGGGVGLIAEATSSRSKGGGNAGPVRQQPQRIDSYRENTSCRNDTRSVRFAENNAYDDDDGPPSYEQANTGTRGYTRRFREEDEEDTYDYGEKLDPKNTTRGFNSDRGLSDDYYDPNSSRQDQQDPYIQEQIRNEDYTRWQRQNFPSNPLLPPPMSVPRPRSAPVQGTSSGLLPLPVIIPQRRPENKSRGWMIAYPPCLVPLGISQDTFVSFLVDFNKACQASPALDAVNLAAFGVGFAPGIAPIVVSMVVPAAVKMAKNAQTKTQANKFLDKVNKEIFEPRGLIAMITTFNNQQSQTIHYDTQYANGQEDVVSAGEFSLPRSAELVYLDNSEVSSLQNRSGMAKTGHFIGDYYDRRAQVQYSQNNPQDQDPNRPQPRFANGFSDPANHGSLLSVLSGGAIQRPSKSDRRSGRRDRKDARKERRRGSDSDDSGRQRRVGLIGSVKGMIGGPEAQGRGGLISLATSSMGGSRAARGPNPGLLGGVRGMVNGPGPQQNQGLIKGLKGKIAQEDLLYLMVVERPADLSTGRCGVDDPDEEYGDVGAQSSGAYYSETYGYDDARR